MRSACSFRFGFVDVTARGDARLTVSQNHPFCRLEDINAEEETALPAVFTLEEGFGFPLDSSRELMPGNPASLPWGLWSPVLCEEDGHFAQPLTLSLAFRSAAGAATLHSSAGVTLFFLGTLPALLQLRWYNAAGTLLAEGDFVPDSFVYFCDKQVEGYARIEIVFSRMQAGGRFFRLHRILFGAEERIDETRTVKAVLTEELDVSALTLPIGTLELSFYTPNGRFSLLDPKGAYQFFQWKQELDAAKTLDGQVIPLGRYYLQEAEGAVDAVTTLSCVDVVGILDALEFMGGLYEAVLVSSILAEILNPEGLRFALEPSLANARVSGYLPIGSKREALRQICFALGATLDTKRSETLYICRAATGDGLAIPPARKIPGHRVSLGELVTQVEVTAHKYNKNGLDPREISRDLLAPGEHTIRFGGPTLVSGVTGATLVSSHVNYCVLRVAGSEVVEVVVSGYEYHDTTTVYTAKLGSVPVGARSSVKKVETATLVNDANAQAVAQRLLDHYGQRYTSEGRVLPGSERVGERIVLSSLGGRDLQGHALRLVTDLHGGCLETITVRGS